MTSQKHQMISRVERSKSELRLSERQAMVLSALVAAYVGEAGPVSSGKLKHLISTPLSAASIRNTLAELHESGLVDKAHASAGRVPTPAGMRLFIDDLLDVADLGPHLQRLLERALQGVDAAETPRQTSHLLSEYTRQLGFVMAPRVEYLRMRSVHLVAVGGDRVLAVLVAENGGLIQRVIDYPEAASNPSALTARSLERVSGLLAERLTGKTLVGLRQLLEAEERQLRGEASEILQRAWALGIRTCDQNDAEGDDLVIATRITLLNQPEFSDPEKIRGLFAALETNRELLALLREIAHADRGEQRVELSVSLGQTLGEPSLRDCALVAMPYGLDAGGSLGVLGVIGPQRMDYARVIPLVSYCAELVTRKLLA